MTCDVGTFLPFHHSFFGVDDATFLSSSNQDHSLRLSISIICVKTNMTRLSILSRYIPAAVFLVCVFPSLVDRVDSYSPVSLCHHGNARFRTIIPQQLSRPSFNLYSTATEESELKLDSNGIYDLESKEDHL